MTSSHSIYKNKLIPLEIPIQPPAVTWSEIKTSDHDFDKKLIPAFNQLHMNMLAINHVIRNALQYDSDTPHIPLALIKIICSYCSLVEEYEQYRLNGVRDILPTQVLVVKKDNSYPLVLTHQANGNLKSVITANSTEKESCVVEINTLRKLSLEYIDSGMIRCLGVKVIPENHLIRDHQTGKFYGEGFSVIDSAKLSTFTYFGPLKDKISCFEIANNTFTILKIPQDKVADIAIGGLSYKLADRYAGTLSYTLLPSDICPYRVFNTTRHLIFHKKLYDPTSSIFSKLFFCCRRKHPTDLKQDDKKNEAHLTKKMGATFLGP
ncbi:MAG: hypothetical protein ACYCQI_13695 [Gammaproteobacteria bacterium]